MGALTQLKKAVRERLRLEVAWLQAQIEPHFFFNTLNSIVALSDIDQERMQRLIEHFGDFLQEKFKFQNTDTLVPLENELSLVRSYLYIEKQRFGERLQVLWEVDDTPGIQLPPFTIQPLVENAVRHGIMKKAQGGQIVVRIEGHADCATISVIDNGVGMDQEIVQQFRGILHNHTFGVGLVNVHLRLKRLYGQGLNIESTPGKGTTISFVVSIGEASIDC